MTSTGIIVSQCDDYDYEDVNNYCIFYRNSKDCTNSGNPFYWASLPLWVLSVLFFVLGGVVYKRYAVKFQESTRPADALHYSHVERGSTGIASNASRYINFWKGDFLVGFFASFFIPGLGTGIVLASNRRYMARYGAALGFCLALFAFGIASTLVGWMGFMTGNPGLIVGLFMAEIVVVHFHRVIMTLDAHH